ncbi:hypothetical protein RC1_1884 [Rhodospirillum centenum SW]|uniref:Uncharacterized protein n=1 Tax=Rhodospirillum centenum (strain ATCC 51521 / SW) TaxID=414684 RepID=B6INU6_RHOCS|nr:hypothetical protein RC1_1884 [Rhodospirillum centenum SW]
MVNAGDGQPGHAAPRALRPPPIRRMPAPARGGTSNRPAPPFREG